jgi:hypothetical protein
MALEIFWSKRTDNKFDKILDYLNTYIGYLQKHGKKTYGKKIDDWHTTRTQTETYIEQLSINVKLNFKYPIKDKFVPFLSLGSNYEIYRLRNR